MPNFPSIKRGLRGVFLRATLLFLLTIFTFASFSTGFLFTSPALAQTCTPTWLGSYDTPGLASGLYVSGTTAYVADYGSGLQIINVTDPTALAWLGSYNTPSLAYGVYVSGTTAYVADAWSGLQIIDVTDPTAPALLGSYNTPDAAIGVYVSGTTAYVADGGSGLQILNVTDPTAPALLGSYDTPGYANYGVYVSGTTAYVGDYGSGLQIIDVTDPTAPAPLGSYDTPSLALGLYVSGTTAYVADWESGLQIIDVSNPSAPALLGSYDTPAEAYDVYVSGTTAYVADDWSGLQIIDVNSCGVIEDCTNGIDDDNDGLVDCEDPDCANFPGCIVVNNPPDCSGAYPDLTEVWPPNHKMVGVNILGVTDADGDPVTITITGITQDEPLNGLGDGDTCPDGAGVGSSVAQVRAERAGTRKVPGNGRVYEISFTASDGKGGECNGSLTVCVPHDMRPGHVCVDDGQVYDSTTCP